MNLHIELTNSKNFAAWEGGAFNPQLHRGDTVLLAGPDGEKLNVIFNSDVTKRLKHALYVLETGHLVAEAHINRTRNRTYKVRINLSKITRLYTETIQGHPVPKADMETIWMCQRDFATADEMLELKDYKPSELGYREEYHLLMKAALEKALVNKEEQRVFWGNPRRTVENE